MPEKKTKRMKLNVLKFTNTELVHLRDLFGIMLPSEGKSLSTVLSHLEGRPTCESKLWAKIENALGKAGLPVGDEAPDFAVTFAEVPNLTVTPLFVKNEIIEVPIESGEPTS
jgi:hypothetical protein